MSESSAYELCIELTNGLYNEWFWFIILQMSKKKRVKKRPNVLIDLRSEVRQNYIQEAKNGERPTILPDMRLGQINPNTHFN